MKNLSRLLRYARPHWRPLAIAIVAMLAQVGTALAQPWPFKLLVDSVLGRQPLPASLLPLAGVLPGSRDERGLLAWLCLSMVLVVLAGIALGMVKSLASVTFGQRVTYDLGADLFLHLQRQSLLFHSRHSVGDTATRVTGDASCVQLLVTGASLPALQSSVTIVTSFIILWQVSPSMTLVSLGAIPLLALSMRIFSPPMKARNRARRDLEGSMMAAVQQTLGAMPAVQAFTREDQEQARFRRYADRAVRAYQRTTRAELSFQLVVGVIFAIATASLMYVGGRDALEGTATTGTIVLFMLYLLSFYVPLANLSSTVSTVQLAAAQADRVRELLDLVPDVRDVPGARAVPLRGAIRYEDVRFGYLPGAPVLHGISCNVRPGEVVAIAGPTGAGKTTLVSLLTRFFDPWSGRVTVDGHDIRHLPIRSLRQQVATVLQEPFIFPITVAENIAYGRPEATREEIVAAAVAANADEFIRRMPEGYETIVGERGATLSGGEKQRLSLARAFLMDAPILILDEPTSALDARTEARLLEALSRLMERRTTLIIAHWLSTIRNADRILVMDRGEIVEQGRHEELTALGGLYAELYHQQMEFARHEALSVKKDGTPGTIPRIAHPG